MAALLGLHGEVGVLEGFPAFLLLLLLVLRRWLKTTEKYSVRGFYCLSLLFLGVLRRLEDRGTNISLDFFPAPYRLFFRT